LNSLEFLAPSVNGNVNACGVNNRPQAKTCGRFEVCIHGQRLRLLKVLIEKMVLDNLGFFLAVCFSGTGMADRVLLISRLRSDHPIKA
jgi:hypothetical protein